MVLCFTLMTLKKFIFKSLNSRITVLFPNTQNCYNSKLNSSSPPQKKITPMIFGGKWMETEVQVRDPGV